MCGITSRGNPQPVTKVNFWRSARIIPLFVHFLTCSWPFQSSMFRVYGYFCIHRCAFRSDPEFGPSDSPLCRPFWPRVWPECCLSRQFQSVSRNESESPTASGAVCTWERERESDIRFEFRFVSLLVITQCFPAQRRRSIEAGSPTIMYCLPATCHGRASLNSVLASPTWTHCSDCLITVIILYNRPRFSAVNSS
jgi:hypothetical protein